MPAENEVNNQHKNKHRTLPVRLRELSELYNRFRLVFLLTTLLTALLATYVALRIIDLEAMEKAEIPTICALLGAAVLLCVAQYLCLRYTTRSSREKIEALTFFDALTEVHNYRYLKRRLARELQVARRFRLPLAVAYMDLDDFKRVNDMHGHQLGNEVLREAAKLLDLSVRANDLFGRMGGDEFLLILPATSREEARRVCERARERMEQNVFRLGFDVHVDFLRMSIGVASYPVDAQTIDELISRAIRSHHYGCD